MAETLMKVVLGLGMLGIVFGLAIIARNWEQIIGPKKTATDKKKRIVSYFMQGYYQAHLESNINISGRGNTPREALGHLIEEHAASFGFEIVKALNRF